MSRSRIVLDDYLEWSEALPRPNWTLLDTAIGGIADDAERIDTWNDLLRQWTTRLARDLGPAYELAETVEFFVVAPTEEACLERLASFAERCRRQALAALPDGASFEAPGKQVIIAIADLPTYYDYLAPFYAEGEYGGSGGMRVRHGYPHTVTSGRKFHEIEATVAHELTHAALYALDMPAWLEEGLTQRNESLIAGRAPLMVDDELAGEQKGYWRNEGLDGFWRGKGFHRADEGQKLSYQLSEILLRLLFEDFRPRWFGFDQEPFRRLRSFLAEARSGDCGQAAAVEHLRLTLGEVAAKFLGPGDWEPRL